MDYSKWDALGKEVDDDERQERETIRESNRKKYYQEQAEKSAKLPPQAPGAHRCCGYADPEQLKAIAEQPQKPKISAQELHAKQLAAVNATREHGNQLVKEGNLDQAYQVYERGALIIAGMIGEEDLSDLECTLNLNMALVKLKQQDYLKCIECVKMALAIQPKNVKAHYRMGQAYLAMGEYGKATDCFNQALSFDPNCREAKQQLRVIRDKREQDKLKENEFARTFAAKMALSSTTAKTAACAANTATNTNDTDATDTASTATPTATTATTATTAKTTKTTKTAKTTTTPKTATTTKTAADPSTASPTDAVGSAAAVCPPTAATVISTEPVVTMRLSEEEGPASVRARLSELGLSKYTDMLLDEGFDSVQALRALTLEDLMAMGLKRGHARLLLQQLLEAK